MGRSEGQKEEKQTPAEAAALPHLVSMFFRLRPPLWVIMEDDTVVRYTI